MSMLKTKWFIDKLLDHRYRLEFKFKRAQKPQNSEWEMNISWLKSLLTPLHLSLQQPLAQKQLVKAAYFRQFCATNPIYLYNSATFTTPVSTSRAKKNSILATTKCLKRTKFKAASTKKFPWRMFLTTTTSAPTTQILRLQAIQKQMRHIEVW